MTDSSAKTARASLRTLAGWRHSGDVVRGVHGLLGVRAIGGAGIRPVRAAAGGYPATKCESVRLKVKRIAQRINPQAN